MDESHKSHVEFLESYNVGGVHCHDLLFVKAGSIGNIRQPSPPPVLAQVLFEPRPIFPSRVADRPGPSNFSKDRLPSSDLLKDLPNLTEYYVLLHS